jgi:hypothetical protein
VSIKKRIIDLLSNVYVTGITFFSLSYIGVSAIVEINTGTAYRHRVVLIPALILLIVGTHDIANKREPARDLTQ